MSCGVHAIKINGIDIKEKAKPGEVIHFHHPDVNNILLTFWHNGDLDIGCMNITNVQEVDEYYTGLLALKDTLAGGIAETILSLKAGGGITLNGYSGSSNDKIILCAQEGITAINAILKSSAITFIANQLTIDDGCFLDAQTLQIEPNNQTTALEIVKFSLNDSLGCRRSIQANVDFRNIQDKHMILVTGTQEVWLKFKPEAFER